MFDLKRTHFSMSLQKDVATGQVVEREGVVLRAVMEAGEEKVQKADALAATYKIVGFAVNDNEQIGIIPVVEDLEVPGAPGPYTVQLVNTNIVGAPPTSSIRVQNLSTLTDMTEVAGAPGAAQFQPAVVGAITTGLLTFNVAQAGVAIRVWYRANLTVAQSRQRFYQRNINNQAGALFNSIVVGGGVGEIYTSEYDTNVDWSAAVPGGVGVITTGPDGILTIGGAGSPLPGGRVIHVPNTDNAMLGVAFNLPG